MKYAIYQECNIITFYEGEVEPILTPNSIISEEDFAMAKNNPTNFRIINNKLIPLENQMYYLRIKRDYLLQESDRYILADYPIKNMTKEEWSERVLNYRQKLRDFPSTCDIHNPIFPTPPTEG